MMYIFYSTTGMLFPWNTVHDRPGTIFFGRNKPSFLISVTSASTLQSSVLAQIYYLDTLKTIDYIDDLAYPLLILSLDQRRKKNECTMPVTSSLKEVPRYMPYLQVTIDSVLGGMLLESIVNKLRFSANKT